MATKLICLIGASGSGKTTVAKELEKAGYNVIQSYTTRPPRYEGEWGHTFIEEWIPVPGIGNPGIFEILDVSRSKVCYRSDMIAYFNSYNSGHHYFATDEQVVRGKINIYVVDPKGAEMVHDFYKGTDVEVLTIYLQVDWIERRGRLMSRGDTYRETMVRLRKDDKLFQTVKCDYAVDANPKLNTVLANIEKIIEAING